MTELTCSALHVPGGLDDRSGSVGLIDPNVSVKLLDDSGLEVGNGQRGEIFVKGPNVCMGYWRNQDATRQTRRKVGRRNKQRADQTDGHVAYVALPGLLDEGRRRRLDEMLLENGKGEWPSDAHELDEERTQEEKPGLVPTIDGSQPAGIPLLFCVFALCIFGNAGRVSHQLRKRLPQARDGGQCP